MFARFIISMFICALFISDGYPQPVNLHFEEYNYENGLSSNRVECMKQDSDGFLWIGTASGLNRFDGNSFEHYFRQAGGKSLAGNYIKDLVCLPNHRIAIATTSGLSFLDTHADTFYNFRYDVTSPLAVEHNCFNTLSLDRDGNLWAGTACDIFIFNSSLKLIHTIHSPYAESDIGKKIINWIWRLTALPDGTMLAETDADLIVYNIHSFISYSISAHPKSEWAFLLPRRYPQLYSVDAMSRTWFLHNDVDSLFCYDWEKHSLSAKPLFKGASSHHYLFGQVYCLSPDSKFVYMAEKGLYQLDSMNTIHYVEDIPTNLETMVFLPDRQGNLWIGTSDGLFESSPLKNRFHIFAFEQEKKNSPADLNFITRIGDNLWLGSDGNGFFRFNLHSHSVRHFLLSKSPIDMLRSSWNIQPHRGDTFWIGTAAGLIWFDTSNSAYGRLYTAHPPVMDSFPITTQFKDKEGLVWMGIGAGHGVIYFDSKKSTFRAYGLSTLPLRHPTAIAEDESGNIWMASQKGGGLVKWKRSSDQFTIMHATDSTPFIDEGINSIATDGHGHLWIASSSSGLVEYDLKSGRFTVYGRENGLSYERIDEMNVSGYPYLWIITSFGLNRFNVLDKTFESFYKKDGLPTDELSSGNYFDPASGNMYLGWIDGLIQFEAAHFFKSKIEPAVFIDKVLINDIKRNEDLNKPLLLKYGENNVVVDFTAIDLVNGADLKFRYRFGNKSDWINLDKNRQIHFSNLSPGSYSLLIEVSDKSGIWNEKATALKFAIAPPFWRTIWFYFLVVILVSGAVFVLYRFRIRQMQKLFDMRNRIAQDLHDDIGGTMTAMNFTNELAMQKLNEPDDAKELMLSVSEDLRSTGEMLDDIVWMVNPKNDSIEQVIARMRRYASRTWEAAEIDFSIEFENASEKIKLNMDQRHDLYLIFKEAVNNVTKHSACTKAFSSLTVVENSLCLEVKDNGAGFDIHAPSSRNGLSNMRSRIEKWKGDFTIKSSKENGTQVSVRMPITQKGD